MIIAEKLLVGLSAVMPRARLVEDLGADSLNVLEIVLDINEAFEIELSTNGLARVRKVEDLHHLVGEAFALK
ncbi:hypothetical protein C4K35_4106 [Pseudomonas chlororaphis subsp. piscium]|uniref:phosphopantetheine-binding protein n=1 Tax=Pseudomonas chlororaphis TaxID=587753 RepID=UPI000F57D5B3|nr:phosphopantetheine-binding protein [Pseudomonas chlororaphis]AZC51685.1 hypothetical protein C4K35_4106 [Pseudomonas chlororaphis subsp. piscium]